MSQLHDLTEDDCWDLIAQGADAQPLFARIGWTSTTGPVVIPVNYVVHERSVWIRTSAYSSMAEEVDESLVAVEMDDVDAATHTGWSVLLRGRAEVLYREDRVPDDVLNLHAWATGPRPLWVRLTPEHITGRRLA